MKVLSLTEPFATLIKEKKKLVETRSWKTDYRGPLYIHASMTSIAKKDLEDNELISLVENKEMNFGSIICKCNLVDCVYMIEKYVNDMKKDNHQEYICGEYKVGRYAWILENIEPLKEPIKAKGQLGIWNYYYLSEVMDMMDEICYGWIDCGGVKHKVVDHSFDQLYQLQSPKDLIKSKCGVCFDQVELERYYLSTHMGVETYFIVYYDHKNCPAHAFLTLEMDNKYYWFEHSWNVCKGIHVYDSKVLLLKDVRDKFIHYELQGQFNKNDLCLYEYKKPKYHISCLDFYRHCEHGIMLNLDQYGVVE